MDAFPEAVCWKACVAMAGAGGSAFPPDKTSWISLLTLPTAGAEAFRHYISASHGDEYASVRRCHTLLAYMRSQTTASYPSGEPHAFKTCGLKTDGGTDYEMLCHARSACAAWRQAVAFPRAANGSFRDERVVKMLLTALWHLNKAGSWPYAIDLAPPQFHPGFRAAVEYAFVASIVQNAFHAPDHPPPPSILGFVRIIGDVCPPVAKWAEAAVASVLIRSYHTGTDHTGRAVDAISKQEALQQLYRQAPAAFAQNTAALKWLRLANAMNGILTSDTLLTFGRSPRDTLRITHLAPAIAAAETQFTFGQTDNLEPYTHVLRCP